MPRESKLLRWKKREKITYDQIAARCAAFGWNTSGGHLKHVAHRRRRPILEKARILSKATNPQEVPVDDLMKKAG